MRSSGRHSPTLALVAIAMATTGSSGVPVGQVRHAGAGIARRDAHHARGAEERSVLEEVDVEAELRAESFAQRIVRVEAGTIVVEADGANYAPAVKRESKKKRRARQQEQAREQQQASLPAESAGREESGGADGRTDTAAEALSPIGD